MKFYGGDETTETQRFIKMFDKFFDVSMYIRSPDIRSPDEYRRKRKPDLKPLCDDNRLVRVYCMSRKKQVIYGATMMLSRERHMQFIITVLHMLLIMQYGHSFCRSIDEGLTRD